MTEIRVPTLGESVTEATVATWFKKPGDPVAIDEMLCELETDKVTVEVPVEFLNQDVCPGLKKGGVLNLVRRIIELNCNASNIPDKLQFDLQEKDIGDAIKISNIDLPEGVKPTITDRDFVVATLVPPTIEVEEEPKPEEETEGGAEEGAEEGTDEKEKTEDVKEQTEDKKQDKKEDSKKESK